jgi:CMP-N-acetylneuraminic acid synthetase
MRHHSQRVPEKNFRPLAGKPLFHYILETLQNVPEIQEIVVDTDSTPIKEGIQKRFPGVTLLDRPVNLRADDIPMNEILAYDISRVQADLYLQTHSTNPLVKASTISRAIQELLSRFPAYDSLFSVTRLQTRLWDELGRAINHNPEVLLQTQDLPPVFEENSCLYIFSGETFTSRRNRLGERPLMYEIDPREAWDIDEEIDFDIVQYLINMQQGG